MLDVIGAVGCYRRSWRGGVDVGRCWRREGFGYVGLVVKVGGRGGRCSVASEDGCCGFGVFGGLPCLFTVLGAFVFAGSSTSAATVCVLGEIGGYACGERGRP